MDEQSTPTHKKIGIHLVRVLDEISPEINSGEDLSLDQIKSIISVALFAGRETLASSMESLNAGIEILKIVSESHPDSARGINAGLLNIAGAIFETTNEVACEAISRELTSFKPLANKNSAKSVAIERAKEIAKQLWDKDITRSIRIGDMADKVYRALASEGLQNSLPETTDRVKAWIKPVTPDYARLGGRSKKTT